MVQYQNANIYGGYLFGPGTHVLAASTTNTFNAVTINAGTVVQQNGPAMFTNVDQLWPDHRQRRTRWPEGKTTAARSCWAAPTTFRQWGSNGGSITIQSGGLLNNHRAT